MLFFFCTQLIEKKLILIFNLQFKSFVFPETYPALTYLALLDGRVMDKPWEPASINPRSPSLSLRLLSL
jgi:hypothetical protein